MATKVTRDEIVLEVHRANLASAQTFEEYRDHHVAYIDCLIERERARHAAENAERAFVDRPAVSQAWVTVPEGPQSETPS